MTIEDAQKHLHQALCKLEATGSVGFEEFMASALSEFTGQDFCVAKSSHQFGTDVRSVPHNFFRVGVEGKRYGQSTSLPVDHLLYKIADASSAPVPVDVWILAATRRIDVSDRERMHAFGERNGIGVIVLDWPNGLAELHAFGAICASVLTTCKKYLTQTESIESALQAIRESAEFEEKRSRVLKRLTRADVGYQNAKKASQIWMKTAQSSLANARSRLGGHHNLGQSEFGVIPRTEVNERLDTWYRGGESIAALLGDEGIGKSWAALNWHNQLKSSEGGAPLTIFLSAKRVDQSDVRRTLARALRKQTGILSESFWERRLALWESRANDCDCILILVDGLNENFNFAGWAEWLQPLFEDHLSGMYRVLLSCWPNWWKGELSNLANLTPNPREIEVNGFNDTELDALLAAMKMQRSDFAPDVLELMRIPRLSSLVAKHGDTLKDSGDVTAERVVYEDWKDRRTRRGTTTGLSDEEMREFVAELGNKLKDDISQVITRKEVIQSLSKESGKTSLELKSAITEISSGAWLKPGSKPNTFRVSKARIPFVLGATLVSEVVGETEVSVIAGTIAGFLDPLKGHRLGAATLRAAMSIALIQSNTGLGVRNTILARWLSERNFGVDDFEAFWRLADLDPRLFLSFAKRFWLARSGSPLRDEVLIAGLSNAANFESFGLELTRHLTSWLGTAWPDPRIGAGLGGIDAEGSVKRSANTRARYKEWLCGQVVEQFPKIELKDDDGWTWLSHRALAILSHLKRAPFVSAFEAWALSRAVMKNARHIDQVEWLLRLNPGDIEQSTEVVGKAILRLQGTQDPIAQLGAKYLASAMSRVEWEDSPVGIDETLEEKHTTVDVCGLEDAELIVSAGRFLSPVTYKQFNPMSGKALVEEIFRRELLSTSESFDFLVDNLSELIVVLSAANRGRLQETIEQGLNEIETGNKNNLSHKGRLKLGRLLLDLYDAEPFKQSTVILGSDIGCPVKEILPYCKILALDDIAQSEFSDVSADRLANWLEYLGERLSVMEIAELDWLKHLVQHEDSTVRLRATALAAEGRNLPALEAYVRSPYFSPDDEDDFRSKLQYEYCRNRAILELTDYCPDESVRAKLNPEYIALVAAHERSHPEALGQFNAYLRSECEALTSPQTQGQPNYWCRHKDAIDALLDEDLGILLEWLVPWLDNCEWLSGLSLMDFFPFVDLMEALGGRVPEVSLRIYRELMKLSSKSIASSDGIEMFPFEVEAIKESYDLCDDLLINAVTDKKLLEIAVAANKNDRIEWLMNNIEHLYNSRVPADVAKAYTLLGMCESSERVDAVWDRILAKRPVDAWLNRVLLESIKDYKNGRIVRNKLMSFTSIEEPFAMQHALKYVSENCDARCVVAIPHLSLQLPESSYRHRVLFGLLVPILNRRIRRDKERRKKKLFHTLHGFRMMAPWH